MIYAQVHNGGVASRLDQPDDSWLPFDALDYTWLTVVDGIIVIQEPAPPIPPPLIVTPFQFKAALIDQKLYAQVQTAVANADQLTQLAWNEAQQFVENDPMIIALATALNLQSQIHSLFLLAETLQA